MCVLLTHTERKRETHTILQYQEWVSVKLFWNGHIIFNIFSATVSAVPGDPCCHSAKVVTCKLMKTAESQQNYVTVWIWNRICRLVCLHTGSSDTGPVRRSFRTLRYGDRLAEAWVVTIWRLILASSSGFLPLPPNHPQVWTVSAVRSLH